MKVHHAKDVLSFYYAYLCIITLLQNSQYQIFNIKDLDTNTIYMQKSIKLSVSGIDIFKFQQSSFLPYDMIKICPFCQCIYRFINKQRCIHRKLAAFLIIKNLQNSAHYSEQTMLLLYRDSDAFNRIIRINRSQQMLRLIVKAITQYRQGCFNQIFLLCKESIS